MVRWSGLICDAKIVGNYRIVVEPERCLGRYIADMGVYDNADWHEIIKLVAGHGKTIHTHLYHEVFKESRPAIISPTGDDGMVIRVWAKP